MFEKSIKYADIQYTSHKKKHKIRQGIQDNFRAKSSSNGSHFRSNAQNKRDTCSISEADEKQEGVSEKADEIKKNKCRSNSASGKGKCR